MPIYAGSVITKAQLFTLVFAFILRMGLSGVAIKHFLLVLNTIMPGCLPNSGHLFQKLFKATKQICTHLCCLCNGYLCQYTKTKTFSLCSKCNIANNCQEYLKKGSVFLVMPLKQQLTDLFQSEQIWKYMTTTTNTTSISEIIDGIKYKAKEISFPSSISLTCNTDGVPVFSSSNISLWPVYYTINELPIIYRRKHIILHALWSGIDKPTMECFLQPVVGELKYLYECGFVWKQKSTQFVTKVILGLICCDSVACPLLQNFKQFNGMFGCSFCLHPGTNVAKGRGTVHAYPCTLENEYENRSHK